MNASDGAWMRRGLFAAAFVIVGLLGWMFSSWLGNPGSSGAITRKEGLKELDAIQRGSIDDLKEVVIDGRASENAVQRIEDYTARIGEVAAALKPNERKSLVAAQRVLGRLTPQMAAYENALRELNEAGASAPGTLTSMEVIDDRVKMTERFQSANWALSDFYRDLETNFKAELDKEQLPETMKAEVMGGFRRGASVDINLTIRECDQEIAANLLATLELFKKQWGLWTVEPDGTLAFDDNAPFGEYTALQEKLRSAGERQQSAQKELLKRAEQEQRCK